MLVWYDMIWYEKKNQQNDSDAYHTLQIHRQSFILYQVL